MHSTRRVRPEPLFVQYSTSPVRVALCLSQRSPPSRRTMAQKGEGQNEARRPSSHGPRRDPTAKMVRAISAFNTCKPDCTEDSRLNYPAEIHTANPAPAQHIPKCIPNTRFNSPPDLAVAKLSPGVSCWLPACCRLFGPRWELPPQPGNAGGRSARSADRDSTSSGRAGERPPNRDQARRIPRHQGRYSLA
jgi:hypothetical protein